jgi:uncharacterized membrane protein YgcG
MRSSLVALLAFAALGCSNTPMRTVTGQLTETTFALDNPVVMAEASDSRVFVTPVEASGKFMLKLPSNVSYRLTLANSTQTRGIYSSVARINWPLESGASRWATLGDGETLDLGMVYQRGHKVSSSSKSSKSGSYGSCKEEDDSKCSHEGESDCDCDHEYSGGDHCDPDGNSSGDDNNCNKDHGYGGGGGTGGGHSCDGGSSSGGGGGSAGGGGGSTPGGPGTPCTTNDGCDATQGLTCIAGVCSTGTIS